MATDFLSSGHSTPSSTGSRVAPAQGVSLKILHQDTSTLTLLVDAEFFDNHPELSHNPTDWSTDLLKIIVPDVCPNVRLYCQASSRMQQRPQVVAAQFDVADYDAVSATRLLQLHLAQWLEEYVTRAPASAITYDRRTGRAAPRPANRDPVAKAPLVSVPTTSLGAPTSRGRPTLFSLVAKLGEPSVTTVEQRHAIRQIITDYLNNEISYGKVFSYIGQVIGYQALENIINSLSIKPPVTQDAVSSTQTQYYENMPGAPKALGITPTSGIAKYTPAIVVSPEAKQASGPTAKSSAFIRSLLRPLRWIRPTNIIRCHSWGQRLCLLDRKCFIFGGCVTTEQAEVKPPTFEVLRVIDLVSLTMRSNTTSLTDCPPSTAGHIAHLGSFASGPICVVHGGAIGALNGTSDSSVKLNARLYGMDMLTKRWMLLDDTSAVRPCARHSHASAILPHNTDVVTGGAAAYAEYLVIYGGVGLAHSSSHEPLITCQLKELVLLNDLWVFDFLTAQWSQVDVGSTAPCPRFGASFSWLTPSRLLLFGGEARNIDGTDIAEGMDSYWVTPPGRRVILSDTWILALATGLAGADLATAASGITMGSPDSGNGVSASPLISERRSTVAATWKEFPSPGPPRAHYAAVGLTACIRPSKPNGTVSNPDRVLWAGSVEACMEDLHTLGWSSQRVIFIISGTTRNADGAFYETPSVLIGLFFPVDDMIIWRSLETVPGLPGHLGPPFRARRGHSAAYFDALAELPSDRMVREALRDHRLQMHNRSHTLKSETCDDSVKPSDDQESRTGAARAFATMSTCVPCILVCGGTSSGYHTRSDVWVLKLSKLYPRFTTARHDDALERKLMNAMLLSGFRCVPSLRRIYGFASDDCDSDEDVGFSSDDLQVMRRIWTDPVRNYQPAFTQSSTSVAAGLMWTLATLVKHPLASFGHLVDNAMDPPIKATTVSVCLEKWKGLDVLSFTNDGFGLSHRGLHLMLKRFGQSCDDLARPQCHKFGIGFKLGVGRLAHNALVLTKSASAYGAALFSSPLNTLMGTTNFACPIVCWSATDGYPVVHATEEAEFGQSVKLLLHNSPLSTTKALEQEFEKFGTSTGTKIILFGLRKDLPFPYVTREGSMHFSSYRAGHALEVPTMDSVKPHEAPAPAATAMEDDMISSVRLPGNLSGLEIGPVRPIKVHDCFPLYTSASESLDYNVATYLYWLHLHAQADIYLNGTVLSPKDLHQPMTTPMTVATTTMEGESASPSIETPSLQCLEQAGIELSATDSYRNSLYRFLQHHLHYKLEFPYLFEPKYGEDNFYGLVGFLNGPSVVTPVCETGVLLYHKGRLITRAVLGIPALPEFLVPQQSAIRPSPDTFTLGSFSLTAVINVPDFLTPRANKEGFLCDADLALHDVYDKLEATLKEYLTVYDDPEKLSDLQQRYVREFDQYREARWNERRRSHGPRPSWPPVASGAGATPPSPPHGRRAGAAGASSAGHGLSSSPTPFLENFDARDGGAADDVEFEARGDEPRDMSTGHFPLTAPPPPPLNAGAPSTTVGGRSSPELHAATRKRQTREEPPPPPSGSFESSMDTVAPAGKVKRRRAAMKTPGGDDEEHRGQRRRRRAGYRRRSEEENEDDLKNSASDDGADTQ